MASASTSRETKKTSLKRSADHFEVTAESSSTTKITKVFPIFSKQQKSTFHWDKALGRSGTCLHGVNLTPKLTSNVAAFDLDGCLIESSFAKKQDPSTFKWWRPIVPTKLKSLHDEGYTIIIFTNQALRGAKAIDRWRQKIPYIASALSEVPFHLYAATAKDGYRKPMPGMWYALENLYRQESVAINRNESFFIGDAAGRAGDHASTDRKFALNVDIPFLTPEEYFLGLPPARYALPGFNVSSLPTDLPPVTPTSTPIVPSQQTLEIVLFVGLPSLGKTSFYRKHFEPAGYVHVNQDTLRTRDKCVNLVEKSIRDRKSCVVDNTNRDQATRKHYIDIAQRHKVPIRCILFEGSIELAWHNNLYRAYNMPPGTKQTKRDVLPYSALGNFRQMYEEPQESEGFAEIKQVNWVFSGSEEERKRWSMWLQIDGK